MAFEINRFSKTSADFSKGAEDYKYDSLTDDKASILVSGYFNGALNGFNLISGSLIKIIATDDQFIAQIIVIGSVVSLEELAKVGGTPIFARSMVFNLSSFNDPPGPNSPAQVTIDNFVRAYQFNNNDVLFLQSPLPGDYKAGTAFFIYFWVAIENAAAGNINFDLDYRLTNEYGDITTGTVNSSMSTVIAHGIINELLVEISLPIAAPTALPLNTQFASKLIYNQATGTYVGTPRVSSVLLNYIAAY